MPKVTVDELVEIEQRTHDIEAERAAKKAEREEKKRQKLLQKQNEARERLVAPIMLLITLIICGVLWTMFR